MAGTTNSGKSYTSLNESIWGTGGSGLSGYQEQVKIEADKRKNQPSYAETYSKSEYKQALTNAGISSDSTTKRSDRVTKEGDAGADEALLSNEGYAYIQYCKKMYNSAGSQADRDYWHEEAERIRNAAGYSGGADGSLYITNGSMGISSSKKPAVQDDSEWFGDDESPNTTVSVSTPASTNSNAVNNAELQAMLAAWKESALQQSNAQIDAAVESAVSQLQRALEDAQPQFKEQAESVAREERNALDNAALYAQLRGDQGGIGQEQYNAIQIAAANNRLAVQQIQTQLATDTARQIEDLRQQGAFEKADAALAISQTYLGKLVDLEQWAAEFQLDSQQFQASLSQWEDDYNLALQKLNLSNSQWQQEFSYTKSIAQQTQRSQLAQSLLSAGISLSQQQRDALGISDEQEALLLWQAQLSAS